MEIDEVDIKILRMLIKDSRTNLEVIAKHCGLSANAIHKRVERLKAAGVITGTILYIDLKAFGFEHIATIGVNLEPNQELKVANLIRKYAYLIHIDRSLGKYDITAFVIVANLKQIEMLKETIRNQFGIRRIAINFLSKSYFNLGNIDLQPTRVKLLG